MGDDISTPKPEREMVLQLVSNLPEQYQPIFGHHKFDATAARTTSNRLTEIVAVADDLSAHLGRPLRILDAGCAQGFVALNLAARGHSVLGVDLGEENIELCKALAVESGLESSCFSLSDIEAVAHDDQKFDLVVALSVLHHVAYAKGQIEARRVFGKLVDKSLLTIAELAEQSESMYWAPSQPTEQEWLRDIVFYRVLSRQKTHLGSVRKSFIVSNSHWHFPGDVRVVERAWKTSNKLAPQIHQGARRFYAARDAFAKIALAGHDEELQRETAFLRSPLGISAPGMVASGGNEVESWLVRQHVEGAPLEDLDFESVPIDVRTRWIASIVRDLAKLEGVGLYHGDVRIWNCFVTEDAEIRLIDFGSITSAAKDVAWPHDVRLSFLLFVDEMYCGVSSNVSIVRRAAPPALESWPAEVAKVVVEWFLRDERLSQFASLATALEAIVSGASSERAESSGVASWPAPVDTLFTEAFGLAQFYSEAVRNRDTAVASLARERNNLQIKVIDLQEAARLSDEARELLEAQLQASVKESATSEIRLRSEVAVLQEAVRLSDEERERALSALSEFRRRRSVRVALRLAKWVGRIPLFSRHRREGRSAKERSGSES